MWRKNMEKYDGIKELLDGLAESGDMNMMGAPRWLLEEGILESKREAREAVKLWLKNQL
jgi:hypothetical protein